MNAIARTNQQQIAQAEHSAAIRTALKSSLYPGASDGSVDMVLAYCQAAALDPMTKPVHIVPMKVSTGKKDERGYDIKATRDVVMPGIGLYRINASRTGQYAGVSEPEYGPTRKLDFKREVWIDGSDGKRKKTFRDDSIEYPEWCRITVDKLVDGVIRKFVAKEYWLENYAEKGDGAEPNSMWAKRPFGQIAKCTEAQALRKAFPEAVGSQPTAEEMEGKLLDVDVAAPARAVIDMPQAKAVAAPTPATESSAAATSGAGAPPSAGDSEPGFHGLSESQKRIVIAKAKAAGLDEASVLDRFKRIDAGNLNEVLADLRSMVESDQAQ
jgi:phage recombination protein Bet